MSDITELGHAPKLHPFEQWLAERPKWLQTAAARMIHSKSKPEGAEIRTLADLCLLEAGGKDSELFQQIMPGALAQASVQPKVRLSMLSDVTGVNAIKDGTTLDFGAGSLTVVYGANGSGKSGYSRLIKQICDSKAKEQLRGNVFKKQQPQPSVRVHLKIGDENKEGLWTLAGGPVPQLRHLHVFDSAVATLYFGPKAEATYEPSRMRFVSSLIAVCDQVAAELGARKSAAQSKLPLFPTELGATVAARFLGTLKAGTTEKVIDAACTFTEEMDQERIAGEVTLAEKDIPGRIKIIDRDLTVLGSVKTLVGGWKSGLGEETVAAVIGARKAALIKRKAAKDGAEKVFSDAPIEGVGQDSWHELWRAARAYSESLAYPGHPFPHTTEEARCVLCQQALDDGSRSRMTAFEAFVRGTLERDASDAERVLRNLVSKLPKLPDAKAWIANAGALKIDESVATAWFNILESRRSAVDTSVSTQDVSEIDWNVVETPMTAVQQTLGAERNSLAELLNDGKRKELTVRVQELLGSQWLARARDAVREEEKRLDTVAALTKAGTLVSTVALTKKNTELSEQELKSGYQERFVAELKALNGSRLPVEPRSKQQGKGRVTFSLVLKETGEEIQAADILSEGERRIIALAAFLADISGSGQLTPFVFDDPISSLDQDFEEHVVERIVKLSTERQVIIFTHRLSLLAQVESSVKKFQDQAKLQKTTPPLSLNICSLRRLGSNVGLVADVSIRDAKPAAALNKLRDESLKKLRRLYDAGDVEAYEESAKSICSDLRILVERCVETTLLNDVVVRFRRSITTLGKIGALAKIQAADCVMIDDLMTRYSVFEHSQSSELPAHIPELKTLEEDVNHLLEWLKEFSNRAVA